MSAGPSGVGSVHRVPSAEQQETNGRSFYKSTRRERRRLSRRDTEGLLPLTLTGVFCTGCLRRWCHDLVGEKLKGKAAELLYLRTGLASYLGLAKALICHRLSGKQEATIDERASELLFEPFPMNP